jgi:hypothetical protein
VGVDIECEPESFSEPYFPAGKGRKQTHHCSLDVS